MFRTALALASLAATVPCLSAGNNNCTGIPVQWTVSNLYNDGVTPSLVTNDGTAAYVNAQHGVAATIGTCGPYDAVLVLSSSTRAVSFKFTEPLFTNSYTPAGLTGSTVNALSVNVRNLLYNYVSTADYTFTTRLGANLIQFGPVRMINSNSQAMPVTSDDSMANQPNADALVYVHHCPKSLTGSVSCPALAHETWFVYPDLTTGDPLTPRWTGTMILTVGNGKNATDVNAGQFSMPFKFAISLLN